MGNEKQVDEIPAEKLDQIIFSFCHLKGNQLSVDSKKDSLTIKKLVELKKRNAKLKIVLSLGGWSGCATCSDVFSTPKAREEFATSTLALNNYFKTDGIDLDWEYPSIEGFPGHAYKKEDKENFSELIKTLRQTLGNNYQLSFAAGGFKRYLEESVDWKTIMPLVDRVNLMSYDLVNGYSTVTGHHTPLYSNDKTTESVDYAVQYLIKNGVPANKIVIGGAFYTRVWTEVADVNHGLYQRGKHSDGVNYKSYDKELTKEKGFDYFWDEKTQAAYFYNKDKKVFATGDDKKSIRAKTKYVKDQHLQGIMFWELTLDNYADGLVNEIDKVKRDK